MSEYDDDPRVRAHPDGTWMVFPAPGVELNVAKGRDDRWYASDAEGFPLADVAPAADRDVVIRALIGEPR
jgi:hypothetical protein